MNIQQQAAPANEPDPLAEFTIRCKTIPSSVPASVRARRMLKCLLRSFGFRCELIVDQDTVDDVEGTAEQ